MLVSVGRPGSEVFNTTQPSQKLLRRNVIDLTLKAPSKIAADDTFTILFLSFEENKAWCFMWILCQAEDSHKISSIILSEKQWKNIQDCRLLHCDRRFEG